MPDKKAQSCEGSPDVRLLLSVVAIVSDKDDTIHPCQQLAFYWKAMLALREMADSRSVDLQQPPGCKRRYCNPAVQRRDIRLALNTLARTMNYAEVACYLSQEKEQDSVPVTEPVASNR